MSVTVTHEDHVAEDVARREVNELKENRKILMNERDRAKIQVLDLEIENDLLKDEVKKLTEKVKKLTDFHTFMKNSQHSHANELAKERDLYESQRDEAIEEVKKLKEDMEDMYDEEGAKDCCEILGFVHEEDFAELQKGYKDTKKELHKLIQEKKKWEENEKGIMDYERWGIHGCNSYERFTHAIAELNYSENWITELRYENKELKEEMKKMSS